MDPLSLTGNQPSSGQAGGLKFSSDIKSIEMIPGNL